MQHFSMPRKRRLKKYPTEPSFRFIIKNICFYNTPMISARFHACGAGPQSRFSNGVSTNQFVAPRKQNNSAIERIWVTFTLVLQISCRRGPRVNVCQKDSTVSPPHHCTTNSNCYARIDVRFSSLFLGVEKMFTFECF